MSTTRGYKAGYSGSVWDIWKIATGRKVEGFVFRSSEEAVPKGYLLRWKQSITRSDPTRPYQGTAEKRGLEGRRYADSLKI